MSFTIINAGLYVSDEGVYQNVRLVNGRMVQGEKVSDKTDASVVSAAAAALNTSSSEPSTSTAPATSAPPAAAPLYHSFCNGLFAGQNVNIGRVGSTRTEVTNGVLVADAEGNRVDPSTLPASYRQLIAMVAPGQPINPPPQVTVTPPYRVINNVITPLDEKG